MSWDSPTSITKLRCVPKPRGELIIQAVARFKSAQGLRRENETAYAALRTSISGSSDCSIPSVSWPGRKNNVFWTFALFATVRSIVSAPSSVRGGRMRSNMMPTAPHPLLARWRFRVNR
jgi:hypothetical protein